MYSQTTRTLSAASPSSLGDLVADAPDVLRRDVDLERVADPARRPTGASPSSCAGRSACGTSPRRRRRPRRGRARRRRARARAARRWSSPRATASSGSSSGSSTSHSTSISASAAPRLRERVGADGRDRRALVAALVDERLRRRPGRSPRARRAPRAPARGRSASRARARAGERSTAVCSIPAAGRRRCSAPRRARARARRRAAAGRPTTSRGPAGHCSSASSSTTSQTSSKRPSTSFSVRISLATCESPPRSSGRCRSGRGSRPCGAGSPRRVGSGCVSTSATADDDLPGRAEAALQRVGADERVDERVVAQPLDRRHLALADACGRA